MKSVEWSRTCGKLPKACSMLDRCFNVSWFESILELLEISQYLSVHRGAATCVRYTGPSGPPACPDALAGVAEGAGAQLCRQQLCERFVMLC